MKKLILILLVSLSFLSAASYESMGSVKKAYAFDLRMTDYGASFGGKMQWRIVNNLHAGMTASWTFASSGKEYTNTYYDYFSGREQRVKHNTINLDFVKAGVFLKKHFFTKQLDNSFAPYISIQGGPVLAIDTDNDPWGNITRYKDAKFYMGFYSHFHIGIDFMMERRSSMGIAIGYEINQFSQPVDEEYLKTAWNGAAIILNYGRYF